MQAVLAGLFARATGKASGQHIEIAMLDVGVIRAHGAAGNRPRACQLLRPSPRRPSPLRPSPPRPSPLRPSPLRSSLLRPSRAAASLAAAS